VAQIAYEVTKQFTTVEKRKRMELYNDTRRWCCYEVALLMKKNEIRTDEEAPLTTLVDASVLEYYRASPEERIRLREPSVNRQSFFFRKREKAKSIFFFYKKKSLLLLLSYLFFNSKDMTIIPGVYISTLSQ
jgi:hypothetical protein